jgi:hypothetical protein
MNNQPSPQTVVLRPLPRRIRPLPNEVLAALLLNLSRCNGLPDKTLAQVVTGSGVTALVAVSTLIGLSTASLMAALPELREPTPPKVAECSRHRYLGFDGTVGTCHDAHVREWVDHFVGD